MSARSLLILAPLLCALPLSAQAAPQDPQTPAPAATTLVQAVTVSAVPALMLPAVPTSVGEKTVEAPRPDPTGTPAAQGSAKPLSLRTLQAGPLRSAPMSARLNQGDPSEQSALAYRRDMHTLRVSTLALVLGIVVLVLLI